MKIYIKNTNAVKEQIYTRGINLEDFSKIVDMNYSYLLQILNRKRSVSAAMAKRIADELGKEIKDVFEFRGDE